MFPTRGTLDGEIQLYSWDPVPDCTEEECPAFDVCEYKKRGKCRCVTDYMRGVEFVIFRNYKDSLTEDQWLRVGLELVPLYRTLIRLKIEELGLRRPTFINDKGDRKVSPVYKDIRETIKLIGTVWKSIGVSDSDGPPDPTKPARPGGGSGDPVNGDPLRAKQIEEETFGKKKKKLVV